jgi:pimeloyl-ACP methyl ester carboxylesterase
MRLVEVAGRLVAYEQVGLGPSLVLLHGAVTDLRSWGDVVDLFASTFRVTVFDAPGCGGSDDPEGTWQMDDYADSVAGLLAELELGPAHLVGHSWGSSLALATHLRHPGAARSLVLAGAYAGWGGSLPPEVVAQRLAFAHQVANQLEAGEGWDPATMPGLFSERMSAEWRARILETMYGIRASGTRTMATALAACDLRPALGNVTVPTLLLAGDVDERSPLAVAKALQAAIPSSTLTVLPGLGHEMFAEDPERCCEAVRAFLEHI